MLTQFQNYIKEHEICSKADRILLAVSGGIDSVVMLDLFLKAEYTIGIAHCNFRLRGDESDGDEELVTRLAAKNDVEIHLKRFDTKAYAFANKISIQMAARDLRYNWFKELQQAYDYDSIALAHQADDIIETFFINLSRGTGIKGLTGIKNRSGNLIRPLLFASRDEIVAYSLANNLVYREDSSNQETKYIRNKIRHQIIPSFKEVNPGFEKTMLQNIANLSDTADIYSGRMQELRADLLSEKGTDVHINCAKLLALGEQAITVLFELLSPYGFRQSDLKDILNTLDGLSGKQFFSKTHRIVKDREALILTTNDAEESLLYYIDENSGEITKPIKLRVELLENTPELNMRRGPNEAFFDYDLLEFPLIIRRWQAGEYFVPFGMEQMKKVSDFLINQKLSIIEKERCWLLSSGRKIAWIIGVRSDNRFRVNASTKRVLHLSYQL